jgi:hypothetical protein
VSQIQYFWVDFEGRDRLGIKPGTEAGDRAEEIWARVVELEAAFWPEGEEEIILLSN